ncbi:MAG: diaminopimelate epimerase [Ignavibacteria bacterium]
MKYQIYSGAGNDFVMFDNRDNTVPFDRQEEFVIKICSEQFKDIDGVIFLDMPFNKTASLRMNYYNRDGSYGAMCGNGARCIAQFAVDSHIITKNAFNLEVMERIYKTEIMGNNVVKVSFPSVITSQLKFYMVVKAILDGKEQHIAASWLDVGSWHLVICIKDPNNYEKLGINSLDQIKVNEWGKQFRFHRGFDPPGVNVNFIDILSPSEIRIRTYEKGVERETLSCGTGVIASAIAARFSFSVEPPVRVLTQGGEWLSVDFKIKGERIEDISLEGNARKIGEGEIKI